MAEGGRARRLALVCRWVRPLSGATAVILEQARWQARAGWSVDVYGERLDREALRLSGARPIWTPAWPWGGDLSRRSFAALADWRTARGGYDLVHGHGDGLFQDVLSLHNCVHAAHEAVHGRPLPGDSGLGRLHARILSEGRFGLLIANSDLMRREVIGRFSVDPGKVRVIHPGFDPARFKPEDRETLRPEARRELGLAESDFVFGLITSGDFAKRGVTAFLGALGRLKRRGVAAKALVVGKESRLGPYLRKAAEEGVADSVTFLPPGSRVERHYHALDACVHPALYEEFGLSVEEAMACGLPVITGPRVGAAELMTGPLGELVLDGPPAAEPLAEKMAGLARQPQARLRLGALAAAAVRDNTWDRYCAAVAACYEEVLSAPKNR